MGGTAELVQCLAKELENGRALSHLDWPNGYAKSGLQRLLLAPRLGLGFRMRTALLVLV